MTLGGGSRMGYFMGYIYTNIYIYHQRDAGLGVPENGENPFGTLLQGSSTWNMA